ncbi:hypothetical protein X805_09770 [Sphaerotilus natans subsp. natans DSM 6575]|uniref:SDR family NAD(P)-dependent oxidoreductase n=1 Tax=Sphaerotilus natans subsp. natans DSM 6575 TaxID=1286631 RepID=A0A059KPH2_9BURK|nr:type I polyketide synthase [Sphaerotilus natans]KDB53392.1 hypothetical protein X805_09770 [Sphaerotilus natans subsp. natans DSM 6575]SIR25573.1 epothilone polyketide synthase D [Sphaerotilus natans]
MNRSAARPTPSADLAHETAHADLPALVDLTVREVLGEARSGLYLRRRALREMGLGSRELGEIRARLAQRLGRDLDPLLFFRHATPEALIRHLRQPAGNGVTGHAANRPHGVEPIAIIGMACRFPGGVTTPDEFWALLAGGVDAISEVPPERWDVATLHGDGPQQIRSRFGGFLEREIGRFDAPFFRMAPVEAAAMDPQQKLLLETHWEALEHAGIDPDGLQGTATGIFVGTFGDDFKLLQAREPDIGLYYGTGSANAVTAGRLAYFLGTSGPAFSVDTACSASLVAVHQACQSLHSGESDLALASGVNLLLTPELSIAFSQAGMLAPDGRCKTFDARADGYVRSEGCGVVVLKRLSQAQAAGDRVLAVIRGTAINQDGASNGLTAPNGAAQEAVIRQALAAAGLQPHDIAHVEAHGTGTRLGDPIEVQALQAVYGAGRPADQPLVLGSIKSNIGHAEAAAGIAGLIKLVLTLQHGLVPPHLHLRELNPLLRDAAIVVPTAARPWPARPGEPPRRAAVSSFGFSGTNAHAIVEEAPASAPVADAGPASLAPQLLVLSAQSPAALTELAERHVEALSRPSGPALAAVAATLQQGRAHLAHRLALVATTPQEAAARLQAWLRGEETAALCAGQPAAEGSAPRIAFLFTGQGAQYLQMGRGLYAHEPLFRDRIDRCDRVLREVLGRSLVELLYPDEAPAHQDLLTSHPCGQAANFALECALADLWRAWGIEPDVVLGHSLGDFAAAYAAGVLSLEDGLRLVTLRGRLMQAAHGRMLAVQASEDQVRPFLAGCTDVALGVINGPQSVVISGATHGVEAIAARLAEAGLRTRVLDIPVAAHSPLLDPVLDDFAAAVAAVPLAPPRLTVVSSMTGQPVGAELTDPDYWRRHLRETVRFADGVRTLAALGCEAMVEIGPQATLLGMAALVLEDAASQGAASTGALLLPSLVPGTEDRQAMRMALGSLYTRGVQVDGLALAGGQRPVPVALPTYPFQRQPYPVPAGRRPQAVAGAEAEADALSSTLFVTRWERQSRTPALLAPAQAGRWLIVGEAKGLADALAALLVEHGETVVRLDVGTVQEGTSATELSGMLATDAPAPLRGVVFVPASDDLADGETASALDTRLQRSLGTLVTLVQALSAPQAETPSDTKLWVATHRALPLHTDQPVTLVQTPLVGLGRVAALELGRHWGALVDLDAADNAAQRARALATELLQPRPDGETEVAWRQGRRHVARLERAPALAVSSPQPLSLQAEALYWITGGLGALGLRLAQRLADLGARHLLLTGRRATVEAQAQSVLDALAARGVSVQVQAVDVSDAGAMGALIETLRSGTTPLRGVFHTAGVLDDGVLLNQDWPRIARALAAKVQGAWLLHRLTADLPLDLMVSFASVAGLIGNAGQGSYAAANTFLDGLARWRRRRALPALSVDWGIWADAGMAMRGEVLSFPGVRPMAPERGLAALERVLSQADRWDGQVAIAELDLPAMAEARPGARLLATLMPAAPAVAAPGANAAGHTPLRERLGALAPARRAAAMQAWLQQTVGALLGMAQPPDTTTGFTDLGMDSLMALRLRHRLEAELGCALPSTLAFEYRHIDALAPFLLERLRLDEGPGPRPEALPPTVADAGAGAGAGDDEAIAVIAMACRFPGASTPEDFWTLVRDGVDRVGEIPASRWDVEALYDPQRPRPGRMYVRQGAFLDDVESFDPLFFGISPREAAGMDPKHGLLLETAWEVLERAGIAPQDLLDSDTGVFIGTGVDNHGGIHDVADLKALDTYAITSSGHSVAAGRLAYVLGLQGPTMAVDTACSSSLVALHLAVRSLRQGECRLALAGGASLMLSPTMHVALSQMQVLAPDGRCKAFDAAADGYGRGEGGAMVLLKRLSDARAAGDPILAVIRGSAINHDGAASGLTVPSKHAQQKLLRQALQDARVPADALAYIETHGTGTPLGDPIELRAIGEVFGQTRPEPLRVGTVKANIGHLEPAAGIAGFVKTVLALQHATIPRQIHFHTPNPHIEWDEFAVEVPVENLPWPGGASARRLAGVSSFGISGTNAHLVLEAAPMAGDLPRPNADAGEADGAQLLVLSARSEAALDALVTRWRTHLPAHAAQPLAAMCHTAATGRRHHAHRLALVAHDRDDLARQLRALAEGRSAAGTSRGVTPPVRARLAFLFTGQGSQSVGMGRALYRDEPVFRAAIDDCDRLLAALPETPLSLREILHPADPERDGEPMERAGQAQPALFALEYALACQWRAWGIEPEWMLGHSLGEIVAACLAGVFDLADALKLVAARGRLMEALPQDGSMVSLRTTPDRVRPLLAGREDQVAIAAVNAPDSVVLSGRREAVAELVAQLQAQGIEARALKVTHAFHSPLMAPMLDAFRAVAETIRYAPPTLPVVSNLSGALAGAEMACADYWVRQVREPVHFAEGVETLRREGAGLFLEVGPHPALAGLVARQLDLASGMTLPSLRRGVPDRAALLASLGALFVHGHLPRWAALSPDSPAPRRVLLPTTPFQRQACWARQPAVTARRAATALHPLIDRRFELPLHDEQVFETELSLQRWPMLAEHRVHGEVVSPGACQLAMALAAVALAQGDADGPAALREVVLPQALVLPTDGGRQVQIVLGVDDTGRSLRLISLLPGQGKASLQTHARALLGAPADIGPPGESLAQLRQRCCRPGDPQQVWRRGEAAHIALGTAFRWIEALWHGPAGARPETLGRLRLPATSSVLLDDPALHPGLLDACFQVASLARDDEGGGTLLPFAVDAIVLQHPARGEGWWCHAVQVGPDTWDLSLFDDPGRPLVQVRGFAMRAAPAAAIRRDPPWQDWLHRVDWSRDAFGPDGVTALPAPAETVGALAATLASDWAAQGGGAYETCVADLETLAGAQVLAAWRQAGVAFEPGARWTVADLADRLGVVPAHRRLTGRLLEILGELGWLVRDEGTGTDWTVRAVPAEPDLAALHARFEADHGAHAQGLPPEALLLRRCGDRLLDVLQGRVDPLELLFPEGDTRTAHRLYAESPIHRLMNDRTAELVARLMAALPAERGLRLLEVGGGTGGTTVGVLPRLPAQRCDYLFTDIGPSFVMRARERFAAFPFLRAQTLDIERSPLEQGFARGQADVVLAANVLHATRDLPATLAHVRALLQPGGQLLLLEVTTRSRWVDLTFGLTDGWWRFDDLRQDHPLLTAAQWRELLHAQGFADIDVMEQGGHALIVARADLLDRPLPAPAVARDWLLLGDAGGVAQALAERLRRRGDRAITVAPEAADSTDLGALIAQMPALHGVVHLRALDDSVDAAQAVDPVAAMAPAGTSLLRLAQALLQGRVPPAGLVCATRAAQAVVPGEEMSGWRQAGLWGMGRVFDQEHPELGAVRIDLPARAGVRSDVDADAQALLAELDACDGVPVERRERQIALRGGRRHRARLQRCSAAEAGVGIESVGTEALRCEAQATYLITGGLGGLGLATADRLVARGARHLLLLGRRAPDAAAQARLAALAAQGVEVRVAAGDVADGAALAALLASIDPRWPLRGVVHAVGVLDDRPVLHQDGASLDRVLGPKVRGAWNLHRLTQAAGMRLDFFVMYAAAAGLLGNRGQANHAAANTALDALAAHRRALGLPALAIDWGAWADIGAAAQLMRERGAELVSRGLTAMAPEQALAALEALMATGARAPAHLGVMAIDWATYLRSSGEVGRLPYFAALAALQPPGTPAGSSSPVPGAGATTTAAPVPLRQQLAEVRGAERAEILTGWLQQAVADTLRLTELPDSHTGFSDLGMDSLMTIELRRHLSRALELPLPSTIAFEYPSVAQLRDHLLAEMLAEPEVEPESAVAIDAPAAAVAAVAPDAFDDLDLDQLSEAELGALIDDELARLDD